MPAAHDLGRQPGRLFSLFGHDRGPAESCRTIALGNLREWPTLWATDPRLLPLIGDAYLEALIRANPAHLRFFSVSDPEYPHVPLQRVCAAEAPQAWTREPLDPRVPSDSGIRDKFWQRLFVEETGLLSQPCFAVVHGDRIEGCNAPWAVHIATLECRHLGQALSSAGVPGTIIVMEGIDSGFVAIGYGVDVQVWTRNPHVARHLNGAAGGILSAAQWTGFIRDLAAGPLPLGILKAAFNPAADLGDALVNAPGSYILKPRFGSNGFCVVRVVSHADGHLTTESDCPDTARYLEEFPLVPELQGRDLIAAVATHRSRFVDRARVGLPDRVMDRSILEEEIRQDRAEGSIFEPRVVVQRVKTGSGESCATLGAICKRIDSAVGASVVRDFREEPFDVSLRRFLSGRVPAGDLAVAVQRTRDEILATGDGIQAALVPRIEAHGARVHQFGIDYRLCWNPTTGRTEYPFLEIQFGIGGIDWPELCAPAFAGYQTRAELRKRFGPEAG